MQVDLGTTYLGLRLRSPVIASASPLSGSLEGVRRLAAAGVGAVVLPSVFQEQLDDEVTIEVLPDWGLREAHAGHELAVDLDTYNRGPEALLTLTRRARRAVDIPIIASINWAGGEAPTAYARSAELAGAAAIELNVHLEQADPDRGAAAIEAEATGMVAAVRRAVSVPIAVKLTPYATSLPSLARALAAAGADGLVLFHRLHGARVDLATGAIEPELQLSTAAEAPYVLRWIAMLRPVVPETSIGATTGIHDGTAAARALAVGADAVLIASELVTHGPQRAGALIDELAAVLAANGCAGIADLRARIAAAGEDPRGDYITALRVRSAALLRG